MKNKDYVVRGILVGISVLSIDVGQLMTEGLCIHTAASGEYFLKKEHYVVKHLLDKWVCVTACSITK